MFSEPPGVMELRDFGVLSIVLLGRIPRVVPQSYGNQVWGDWDSVSCYACGLASIDPESDEEGTYGTDPGEGKKMYNHSCDLMDNGIKGNYKFAGQELSPRNHVEKVKWTRPVLYENGTQQQVCKEELKVDVNSTLDAENETVTVRTETLQIVCEPRF